MKSNVQTFGPKVGSTRVREENHSQLEVQRCDAGAVHFVNQKSIRRVGEKVKNINRKYLEETLVELEPDLEGTEEDDSYRTALFLLAAITYGSDTTSLARVTKLPRQFVSQIRQRMISAQLWTEIDVACDHWYRSDGAFCTTYFWLDVLVAEGRVVRRWVEQESQYRYWAEEHAPKMQRGESSRPGDAGSTPST